MAGILRIILDTLTLRVTPRLTLLHPRTLATHLRADIHTVILQILVTLPTGILLPMATIMATMAILPVPILPAILLPAILLPATILPTILLPILLPLDTMDTLPTMDILPVPILPAILHVPTRPAILPVPILRTLIPQVTR